MRRRDRLHKPSVEKAFQSPSPSMELSGSGRQEAWACNSALAQFPRKKSTRLSCTSERAFHKENRAPWCGFRDFLEVGLEFGEIGRFTEFYPGSHVEAERDRVRLALSFSPGVQARPRFSPPLPLVQDRVVSDTEFAAGLRAAKEKPRIRPVVRFEARRRQPPTSESNENLLPTGHQARLPQVLDRRAGMQCSALPAAPHGPARSLRRVRWRAREQREDAPGSR